MRRLVRSEGYARARLVTGTLFAVLGVAIVARTIAAAGLGWADLPAFVLGAAMIALALVRFREYVAARRGS
jgi:hypothetical protein